MKLSQNVLGCVPLTTRSTADGGRRQKGGVQGKLWRHKVTKPRTEPHQGWSCGVRILSTSPQSWSGLLSFLSLTS